MTPSLPEPLRNSGKSSFGQAISLPAEEREAFVSTSAAATPNCGASCSACSAANESAGAFLEVPLPEMLASDLPRASLARWKLLECVGEGGLGVVYRAECVEDGVELEAAVKILRPGLDTGKFREKFVKERQILAGLDHRRNRAAHGLRGRFRWPLLPGDGVHSR